jgi:hypothetical protein
MLALAITGALAFNRLRLDGMARRALAAALLIGIAADGWISHLALPSLPEKWTASRADGFAAVLELPLGDIFGDLAAIYRAIDHRHPIMNGNSGFEPTHYFTLRTALEEHDPTALDGLASGERVLIVLDKQRDPERSWRGFLDSLPRVSPIADDDRWAFFAAEPPSVASVCTGRAMPIAAISTDDVRPRAGVLTDGNPKTWWEASHAQRVGDALILDLGQQTHPCAVTVSVGEFRISYPRKLAVDTSPTGDRWTTVATERTAGLTMRGALADPKIVPIVIALAPSVGRFVRLRVDEPHPKIAWMVTDVGVTVSSEGE